MGQIGYRVQERIFQLLRDGQPRRRQEIAKALSLSMPTTLQKVTELLEAGVIEECGAAPSDGGRKAKWLRLREDAGQAVGINIGLHEVEFLVAGLTGGIQAAFSAPYPFQDEPSWYTDLQEKLSAFLNGEGINASRVLGGGVSFPGIIDGEERQVLHSHILGLSHMGLERFRKALPFPTVFANDANCACFAERASHGESYVYLSLNETVGGAVMLNGRLLAGDTFQAGEIGHMLLVPGGRECYCGKQGCADAYLSPQALEEDGWNVYLEHLAILLTNLRMLMDLDMVVGGQVGARIGPHMGELLEKAARYDRFARDIDYVYPCVQKEHACALGAACFALEKYSARVLPGAGEELP